MKDLTSQVRGFYEKYPFPNNNLKNEKVLLKHAWILKVLEYPIKKDAFILDAGCGTGEISCFLSYYCEKVIGIDFSKKSIELAKKRAGYLGIKNVRFYEFDLTEDNAPTYTFDYIFSIGVLHHIPEVERALETIKMFMDRESLFIASVYNKYTKKTGNKIAKIRIDAGYEKARIMDEAYHPYEHCYSRKEFRKLLEDNGFEVLNEWRKIPDPIRWITKKGGMITFLCRRKDE